MERAIAKNGGLWQFVLPHTEIIPDHIFLHHAGGYTETRGTGGWYNPETGLNEVQPVRVYQVVIPDTKTLRAIVSELAAIFPSEKEFFISDIGIGQFLTREQIQLREEAEEVEVSRVHS